MYVMYVCMYFCMYVCMYEIMLCMYRIRPIKRTVRVEVGKVFCRRDVGNLPFYRTPQ